MYLINSMFLGIFSDFNFLLKIFFFLFIISFIRRKITHNVFALLLISIAIIFTMFFYWPIIGSMYFVYVLITTGISTVLVDFFFVSMDKSPKDFAKGSKSGSSGMRKRDNVRTAMDLRQNRKTMSNLKRFKPH